MILGIGWGLGTCMAQEPQKCTTAFRPKTNETAFAAVGSSLKIADETCLTKYLVIPGKTVQGGVTFPKGEYRAILDDDRELRFALSNGSGQKTHTCVFCDPLDYIFIRKNNPDILCVKTSLKIETCALPKAVNYSIEEHSTLKEGVCSPSLVYFGRVGPTLIFAINDCSKISKPSLTYDLSFGSIIRFLDEEFRVLKADNLGIIYQRLDTPELKSNTLVSKRLLKEQLESGNADIAVPEDEDNFDTPYAQDAEIFVKEGNETPANEIKNKNIFSDMEGTAVEDTVLKNSKQDEENALKTITPEQDTTLLDIKDESSPTSLAPLDSVNESKDEKNEPKFKTNDTKELSPKESVNLKNKKESESKEKKEQTLDDRLKSTKGLDKDIRETAEKNSDFDDIILKNYERAVKTQNKAEVIAPLDKETPKIPLAQEQQTTEKKTDNVTEEKEILTPSPASLRKDDIKAETETKTKAEQQVEPVANNQDQAPAVTANTPEKPLDAVQMLKNKDKDTVAGNQDEGNGIITIKIMD